MTDNALRQALRQQSEQDILRLPSNFVHNTLRRIERKQKVRERREQIAAACSIGMIGLLGLSAILYYYGEVMLEGLLSMVRRSDSLSLLPALTFCAVFLTLLNLFLRRKFA